MTTEFTLEVGCNMLVVGANPSSIPATINEGKEPRCRNWVVSYLTQQAKLVPNNVSLVVFNEKINSAAMDRLLELLSEVQHPTTAVAVPDGGSLKRMLESFKLGQHGVVKIEIPDATDVVEYGQPIPASTPAPVNTTPVTLAHPLPTPATTTPAPDTQPPAPPATNRLSLNELLNQMARIYKECDGDSGKVIAYFRSHGITPEMRTDTAIRQHVYRIRDGKNNGHAIACPTVLPDSKLASEFKLAVETAHKADQNLFGLFGQVARQNEELIELAKRQAQEIGKLSTLPETNARLKARLNPFLKAAGLPEEA